MKNGYRIIDTDTHVGPNLETLEMYASARLRERWGELDQYKQPVTLGGHFLSIGPMKYDRALGTPHGGEKATKGGESPLKRSVSKTFKTPPAPDVSNLNSTGRLADMDTEGVDVHVIIPGTFANAATALDAELATELYGAYHRYVAEYCSVDTDRLKATILLPARDPEAAAQIVAELGPETWVGAASAILPEEVPVDDPGLDPIWAALDEHDLPLLHHSFFYEPPYFPGYRDIWGNVVVARAAAHPWGAARLLGYMTLSGMFDRFPRLRIGFSECSAGWLPAWLIRLQGQADYMANALPERKLTPVEYAQAGHIYCGIELYEGAALAASINEILGDGVLMFSSDYPHNQAEFPRSPDIVLEWEDRLGPDAMTKLMSTNAERYLRL